MADWFFAAAFSRAELYGFGVFILLVSKGYSPTLCLIVFMAWMIFTNAVMKELANG